MSFNFDNIPDNNDMEFILNSINLSYYDLCDNIIDDLYYNNTVPTLLNKIPAKIERSGALNNVVQPDKTNTSGTLYNKILLGELYYTKDHVELADILSSNPDLIRYGYNAHNLGHIVYKHLCECYSTIRITHNPDNISTSKIFFTKNYKLCIVVYNTRNTYMWVFLTGLHLNYKNNGI